MLHNKIRYMATIITMGLLAILYNEYYMGILFLTVLVSPFLLFAILSYVYGKLTYELNTVVHVAAIGETIPVTIQLHNPTVFPLSNICITLSYNNTFSNINKSYKRDFFVAIDRKATTTVTCNLISEHAGNLNVSISKVRIFDYLKLFSLRERPNKEIKVAILPHYHELTKDYLMNSSNMQVENDNFSTIKGGDDPSEVFAIREYREGDRPSRIHWKLSIKQDQLMIKDFSEPINCSVVIFADMGIPRDVELLETSDTILESALSLSYTFMLKGQIHYLSWYDKHLCSCRRVRIVNEKDLFEAVDGLLNSGPYIEDIDMLATYYAEYPNDQYTDLLYVTNMLTHKQLDSLMLIKAIDRQILYISQAQYDEDHEGVDIDQDIPIDSELARKITETGMSLCSIDSSNMKIELEGLG